MISSRLGKYATDLQTFPGDAARAWRSGGVEGVWLELRRRTIDRAGSYSHYLVLEADLSTLREVPVPEGIEIRPFSGPDWSLLGDLSGWRVTKWFAASAAAGRVCLVAWRGSTAVGYFWLSPEIARRYENFEIPMPPDTVYFSQIQVARSERRRHLGAALGSFGMRLARDQGYSRSWMLIRRDNVAAQSTLASLASSRVLGSISRIKLTSWTHDRLWLQSTPEPLLRPSAR